MEVIVGTAGHIDHGKSALVRALTGTDPDRLPEEKARGITIDLGFAELETDEFKFGFVDVPGHERFVRNMLAGASGIDQLLLVIAANEGVMPQTREHFDICRLLGVRSGIVALTKTDLVDGETVELARSELTDLIAGSFLEGAEVIPVSSKLGTGLDEIRSALIESARGLTERDPLHTTRLPIDRSFSVKGFGTVVTGTLTSGRIDQADELELLPQGKRVRVRGLQSHGKKAESVHAGQRAAVNLAGVDQYEIERGMLLAKPGALLPTSMIDADVTVLADASSPLRDRQRVRVHIGTAEAMARIHVLGRSGEIAPGGSELVQLRFEKQVVAIPGDRFIIRKYSPQFTVGGGRVIDSQPAKHTRRDLDAAKTRLRRLDPENKSVPELVIAYVDASGPAGIALVELQTRTGISSTRLDDALAATLAARSVIKAGSRFVTPDVFEQLCEKALSAVSEFHSKEALAKGMPLDALRDKGFAYLPEEISRAVIGSLAAEGKLEVGGDAVRLPSHRVEMSPSDAAAIEALNRIYIDSGLEVPKLAEALESVSSKSGTPIAAVRKLFQHLVDSREIVKVTNELYFSASVLDRLRSQLSDLAGSLPEATLDVSKFKEIAGVSRKYAIPLLEYFDRERFTVRVGDKRVIRK